MVDPVTAGLIIGGVGQLAGSAGGVYANKAAAEEARKNRKFQKKMYRHRYQYTVEDMRRAGLNPALAYQQGAGSAPSGSSAQQENPLADAPETATKMASTALEARMNKAQIENISAQTMKTKAEMGKTMVETNQLMQEGPFRLDSWRLRPDAQRLGLSIGEQDWRIKSLTSAFLDATLQDRTTMQGLQREEMEKILAQLQQEIELRGLERAPLEAQAKFARSWFGSNVAPAMGSASGVAGIASGLIGAFLKWKNDRRADRPKGSIENTQESWSKGQKSRTTTRRSW